MEDERQLLLRIIDDQNALLTQQQVGLIMSHINSYARPSLGDRSPFQVFAFLHGKDTLDKLLRLVCQTQIDPDKIVLKPSLLR